MAPRRSKRSKTKESTQEQHAEEEIGEGVQEIAPDAPSFLRPEVTWTYKRGDLLEYPNKTMFTGYETMAADINDVLTTLPAAAAKEVKKCCFGSYTKLNKFSSRNGIMVHYVIFREVKPDPNPDPTALWFKIGDSILRFSRTEFALVSGLCFGEAKFNPYIHHEIPTDSVFVRLFRGNDKTTTADVARMFINKSFTYTVVEEDKEVEIKIPASTSDYVKLSKLLLACTYVFGYDQTKKAIPIWLWILLENSEEWEAFPWGSYSFQSLKETITNVMRKERVPDSGTISYHLKGNTIAFSAWIFEAIPGFGETIGGKNPKRVRPRFLRYSFVKKSKFPNDRQIEQNTLPILKPTEKEKTTFYWKSLENDPEGKPFAFKFNPNDARRKKPRDENLPAAAKPGPSYAAPSATLHISNEDMQKIGALAGEAAANRMMGFLESFRHQIVKDVVEKLSDSGHREAAPSAHEDFNFFQMHDTTFSPARHASSMPTSHTQTPAIAEATIQLTDAGEEDAGHTDAIEPVTAEKSAGEETGACEKTGEAAPGEGEEAGAGGKTSNAAKGAGLEAGAGGETSKAAPVAGEGSKAGEAGIEVGADTSVPEETTQPEIQTAAAEPSPQEVAEKKTGLKRYGRARTGGAKKARKEKPVAAPVEEQQMPDATVEEAVATPVDEPQATTEHAGEASDAAADEGKTEVPGGDKCDANAWYENGMNNYQLLCIQENEEDDFLLSDDQMSKALDEVMSSVERSTARPEDLQLSVGPVRLEDVAYLAIDPDDESRPVRIRYPARALRSPYLSTDVRAGRRSFHEFMRSEEKLYRNVGLDYYVDKSYFENITTPDSMLEEEHINAYLSILATDPGFAGVTHTDPNVTITSCHFMCAIDEVFDSLHGEKKPEMEVYKQSMFKRGREESLKFDDLEKLMIFADVEYPLWGERMQPWINYEKVVTVCHFSDHWVTLLIDMKAQLIWIYDSKSWAFQSHHRLNRKRIFIPLARLLPQLMKGIGYNVKHNIAEPVSTQWDVCFPDVGDTYKQVDDNSCGLYCLKTVERLISTRPGDKGLASPVELNAYRFRIAQTIYAFSTEPAIHMPGI